MPVVSCPKCNKKFKLSSGQLGKTVKCSSCQTKFRTAAPAAAKEAGSAKPKAESKAKPKSKPAPPAKKKPKTLEDQLFASAPIKPGAPDPLGNFVLEDPGFGERELPDPEDDDGGIWCKKWRRPEDARAIVGSRRGGKKPWISPDAWRRLRYTSFFASLRHFVVHQNGESRTRSIHMVCLDYNHTFFMYFDFQFIRWLECL